MLTNDKVEGVQNMKRVFVFCVCRVCLRNKDSEKWCPSVTFT